MNSWIRSHNHLLILSKIYSNPIILDPNRIANRILYGVDYDPSDVGLGFPKGYYNNNVLTFKLSY